MSKPTTSPKTSADKTALLRATKELKDNDQSVYFVKSL